MKRTATAEELAHAERWLSARAVTLGTEGPNEVHATPIWFFEDQPDAVGILLDQLYGAGDEAYFDSRDEAMDALAVTLTGFADAFRIPG